MHGPHSRTYLAVELTTVFVLFPVGLYFVRHTFKDWIIPTLLVTAGGCLALLLSDPKFDRRRLWNARHLGAGTARILRTFVPAALALGLLIAFFRPDILFVFPRQRPGIWLLVMVLYPLLSVLPQEIIFRTFFSHRYRHLLASTGARVLASGVVFGLAHLFFGNWVAPVLTTVGGVLFARTYERSGSTLQASLEHALWGDFLFTIGLGYYFWGGSITMTYDSLGQP